MTQAVVEELIPRFERSTGDKVVLQFEPSTQLRKRIDAGEPFDLVIMTTALVDDEIKAGKTFREVFVKNADTLAPFAKRGGAKVFKKIP